MVSPLPGSFFLSNPVTESVGIESPLLEASRQEKSVIEGLFHFHNYAVFATFQMNESQYRLHVDESRTMILSQVTHLNPHSRVVVMGHGLLEPLAELADRCGELILLNYDVLALQLVAKSLSRKNVTIKKMDFTNGLYDRLEEVIGRATAEGWRASQFLKEIISLFNNFRPTTFLEDDTLKNTDYVISSLIATQFGVMAVTRINKFFEDHYKFGFDQYIGSLSREDVKSFALAEEGLCKYLFVEYGKSLGKMIKPSGSIFLSDTVATVNHVVSNGGSQTFTSEVSDFVQLEKHFEVERRGKWFWFSRPHSNAGYDVAAYILKFKQI